MSTYTNAFRRGQQVQCRGKLLASGKGPVTLIALALAREIPPPRAPERGLQGTEDRCRSCDDRQWWPSPASSHWHS